MTLLVAYEHNIGSKNPHRPVPTGLSWQPCCSMNTSRLLFSGMHQQALVYTHYVVVGIYIAVGSMSSQLMDCFSLLSASLENLTHNVSPY